MKIGKFDTKEKVLIIAEIGNNHEGDIELAKEMICLAAKSGANAVKFQTIVPEKLVSILCFDGQPITADYISNKINKHISGSPSKTASGGI